MLWRPWAGPDVAATACKDPATPPPPGLADGWHLTQHPTCTRCRVVQVTSYSCAERVGRSVHSRHSRRRGPCLHDPALKHGARPGGAAGCGHALEQGRQLAQAVLPQEGHAEALGDEHQPAQVLHLRTPHRSARLRVLRHPQHAQQRPRPPTRSLPQRCVCCACGAAPQAAMRCRRTPARYASERMWV